jgi:hypothetical protein
MRRRADQGDRSLTPYRKPKNGTFLIAITSWAVYQLTLKPDENTFNIIYFFNITINHLRFVRSKTE